MNKATHAAVPVGQILGCTELTETVTSMASTMAREVWDAAAAQDFCGDSVTTFSLPGGLPSISDWLPEWLLKEFGLEVDLGARQELVCTCDVEPHQDHIHGMVLFLVLHNDGLTFRQGKARHATAAGEFFIFDDRKPHGVNSTRRPGAYLGWAIPLRQVQG